MCKNISHLYEEDRKGKIGGVSRGKRVWQHGGGEVQTCKAERLQMSKKNIFSFLKLCPPRGTGLRVELWA